jgi:hypothetical protein
MTLFDVGSFVQTCIDGRSDEKRYQSQRSAGIANWVKPGGFL